MHTNFLFSGLQNPVIFSAINVYKKKDSNFLKIKNQLLR